MLIQQGDNHKLSSSKQTRLINYSCVVFSEQSTVARVYKCIAILFVRYERDVYGGSLFMEGVGVVM